MWSEVELSASGRGCSLGSLPDNDAELKVRGVRDSRTGKRTWMFSAQLADSQCVRLREFREEVGRDTPVRLRAQLPPKHQPFVRLQMDGCRLTLDGNEMRLENPDMSRGETWLWRPKSEGEARE